MSLLAMLFRNPCRLPAQTLWLVLPVCLAVATVYKTIRTQSLPRLPLQVLSLTLYILVGIAALMAGLWVLWRYWPL